VSLDKYVERKINAALAVLHVVGKAVLGPLWMVLFESVQDAVVLGLLVKVPAQLSEFVLKTNFSGLDQCWSGYSAWDVNRYACSGVVISSYVMWATLIPRILYRLISTVKAQTKGGLP